MSIDRPMFVRVLSQSSSARRIILILPLVLMGCEKSDQLIEGVVREVQYEGSTFDLYPTVHVWPVKDTPLRTMMDCEVFGEFRPGLTFEESAAKFGKPVSTKEVENRTEYRWLSTGGETLAVAKEVNSSGGLPEGYWWTVYAYPGAAGLSLSSLVSSNVLARVRLPNPPYCLVVHDSTLKEGSVWLTVEWAGVTKIRWINADSTKQ